MREYKFRGKRVDNGEWVFGYYIVNLMSLGGTAPFIFDGEYEYQVDPKTVGQYTGDKNRGYEGDVLEWVEPIRGEHGDIEDYEHCRGVVEWDNKGLGFTIRCTTGNEWLEDPLNITIVGNRWDNPDLLGEVVE